MLVIGNGITVGPGITLSGIPIVQTGLTVYLDAVLNQSYSGTGTTWYDASGNNNNGTLINGPTYTSSGGTNYFSLVGSNYVDTNYTMSVSNFTISCVFKRVGSAYWAGMWGSEIWNNLTGYLGYYGAANNLTFSRGGGGTGTSIGTNPADYCTITNFNLYTFTCDAAGASQIYINGSQAATGTISLSSVIPKTILLGCRHTNDGSGATDFGGGNQLALFLAYTRVLTAAEILQNFNAVRDRYGL